MAASLEKPFDFRPPGGQFSNLVGAPINTPATGLVATIDHMIHHVITSMTITTINAPWEGFSGPLYLIADSVFTWTTANNIAAPPGTTLLAGRVYMFVYDRVTGKWYPTSVGH